MAGFADLVAQGVALADSLTATLQANCTYEAWLGVDRFGKESYAAGVSMPTLIERKQDLVVDYEGEEVLSLATISILRPITNNGAAGRQEPIDPRDRFTLPDGTTGRILTVESFVSPTSGAGYFHVVKLGAK